MYESNSQEQGRCFDGTTRARIRDIARQTGSQKFQTAMVMESFS
jgi:hypothetical protein